MGTPPPIIRAMPERKRFFSVDPFPKMYGALEILKKKKQEMYTKGRH